MSAGRLRRLLVSLIVVAAASGWAGTASGAIYVVDQSGDSAVGTCGPVPTGTCSLRVAIATANANPGSVIQFHIGFGGGTATITPTSPLPTITQPVTIDGHSQPYWSSGDGPKIVLDGQSAGAGANGLYITGGPTTVRGLSIIHFALDGIRIEGADGNTIQGNRLGLDAVGNAAGNGGYGIDIRKTGASDGSTNNAIGGSNADDRNVVSANGSGAGGPYSGIGLFDHSDGATIVGNYVGTDTSGAVGTGKGNAYDGVLIRDSNNVTLGQPGAGNVIADNSASNVELDSTANAVVQSNHIGVDAAGTTDAFNNFGVFLEDLSTPGASTGNMIGGTTAGAANQIAGSNNGVQISGSSGNFIKGNRFGLASDDTSLYMDIAVEIDSGNSNTIGRAPGDPAAAGNVMANSGDTAVLINGAVSGTQVLWNDIRDSGSSGIRMLTGGANNTFANNTITRVVGTYGDGIEIDGGTNSQVTGNVITNTHDSGISVTGATTTATLAQNSIADNGALAIDLGSPVHDDGRTANDAGDGDGGANGLQNFPVIASATANADGTVHLSGTLDSTASTSGYTLEFFESKKCPGSAPEAEHYAGGFSGLNTDGSGHAAWSWDITGEGGFVTATATDPAGNTSEISACTAVSPAPFVVDRPDDATGLPCTSAANDCSLRSAIELANANPSDSNVITFDLPGLLTIKPNPGLPALTGPVSIDGRTQTGYSGVPLVQLDGSDAGGAVNGLTLAHDSTVRGLSITDWNGAGIAVTGANNTVQGDYIGTTGSDATGNQTGILVSGASNTHIGGSSAGARNVISGNTNYGIDVTGSSSTTFIRGNYIGTTSTGDIALSDHIGVYIETSTGTVVGGTAAVNRNVISGNSVAGIATNGTPTLSKLEGNYIGTDLRGTTAVPNGIGVQLDTAGIGVGGSSAGMGNVISGNAGQGISVTAAGSTIQGNYIGTTASGRVALGNTLDGIEVSTANASNTVIGGTAAGAGNVVSGNNVGIHVLGPASGVQVYGNLVGTDATGTAAIPNPFGGINVENSPNNQIGNGTAAGRNLISGNNHLPGDANGIEIQLSGSIGNSIQGNYIGTDIYGTTALSTDQVGIQLYSGVSNTLIGGTTAGAGNVISGNNEGIVNFGASTTIQGNLVGTDKTGLRDVGNTDAGIREFGANTSIGGTTGITVGGPCTGACNVFSGNDDYGIDVESAGTGIVIKGNYVGVGSDGLTAVPNHIPTGQGTGIYLAFTNGVQIGGTTPAAANVIGFNDTGILVDGAASTVIQGNYVGLGADGTTNAGARLTPNPLDGVGIEVTDGAPNTAIGGTAAGAGNVISGNQRNGIQVDGPSTGGGATSGTTIAGNLIGLDASGTLARPNRVEGIDVQGTSSTTIGGTAAGAANTISGNGGDGIELETYLSNPPVGLKVFGNRIGTNPTGTSVIGNTGWGVVALADGQTIGGSNAGEGNVISGNGQRGIGADGANTTIRGNLIGTNAAGNVDLGNVNGGVLAYGSGTTVGGTTAGARNVISGNGWAGVDIWGNNVVVQGNYLGTDSGGTTAISNCDAGIDISGDSATIGGTAAGAGNVISGNSSAGCVAQASGIEFRDDANNNVVQGNRIGTNAAGTAAIPNDYGLRIGRPYDDTGSGRPPITGNTIGGATAAAANTIAGNTTDITMDGNSTASNPIIGNWIGTNASDASFGSAVAFTSNESTGTIGGVNPGEGNVIAHHTSAGIALGGVPGPGNQAHFAIRHNSIYANTGPGIELNGSANNAQAAPVISTATLNGTDVDVSGTVTGTASTTYELDFFNTGTCDGSGSGEGKTFAGSTNVAIGSGGTGTFSFTTSGAPTSAGDAITATATDSIGNTSAFSQCATALAPAPQTFFVDRADDAAGLACTPGNTSDCTLRSAIQKSNASPNLMDTIKFAIGTGAQTITPGPGGLPPITDPVTIDATTQPGFGGTPLIRVDGGAAGAGVNGLDVTAGNTTVRGLSITGFSFDGIRLETSGGNTVAGNRLGVTPNGGAAGNGAYGVDVMAGSNFNTIGGSAVADRNVISANGSAPPTYSGVGVFGNGESIRGNYIGTDTAGNGAPGFGNAYAGVLVRNTTNVAVGTAANGNVIGGNPVGGVIIDGAAGTTVRGNRIGTNAAGTASAGGGVGVLVFGAATGTEIGAATATPGANGGNVISGNNTDNQSDGVRIESPASGSQVHGNVIGTTADGLSALGNTGDGIEVRNDANPNTIGGPAAADANVVGASTGHGIFLYGSSGQTVQNNFSGTNLTGTAAIANTLGGIAVDHGNNNQIIGNLASGNLQSGIWLFTTGGSPPNGNTVQGNRVGTDAAGTGSIPNHGNAGIFMTDGTSNTKVGGSGAGQGNTVAYNSLSGVDVKFNGTGNTISQNSIFANGGLGIDLGDDGVTPNDARPDSDSGPNNLQNFPVLSLAQPGSGSSTQVIGVLDSAPLTSYRLDFYDTPTCGNGQGKTWIGWAQLPTDGTGHLDFDTGAGLTAPGVNVGDQITATATDPSGNTSEISACQPVTAAAGLSAVSFSATGSVSAGAQTVPTGNIDLSALAQGNGTTSGTALGGIPLERMALGGIALGGIALGGIGITPQLLQSTLGGVHLADIPLNQPGGWPAYLASVPALAPLATRPLDSVTLSDVLTTNPASANNVHIGDLDVSHTALGGIALGGIALGPMTLSQIPLRTGTTTAAQNADDWCFAINHAPPVGAFTCASGTAIASDTLIQWALRGLPLDQLQLPNNQTGLDGVPLAGRTSTGTTAGLALGGIALGGIALGGIDLHGTALGGIALGGIALGGIGAQSTALGGIALGGINLSGTALGGIALGGINLNQTALGGIALGGINLNGTALGGIALGGINMQSSALGGIALGGIGAAATPQIVDCRTDGYCNTPTRTLAQVQQDGRLKPGATLALIPSTALGGITVGNVGADSLTLAQLLSSLPAGSVPSTFTLAQLVAALVNPNSLNLADLVASLANTNLTLNDLLAVLPPGFTLHDLLAAILGRAGYDWSNLDLSTFPLTRYASVGNDITYTSTFTATGGSGQRALTVTAALPAGGIYTAGSGQITPGVPGTAIVPQVLPASVVFHATITIGTPYTLTWKVHAPLDLGTYPVQANVITTGMASPTVNTASTIVGQTFDSTPSTPADDQNNDPNNPPTVQPGTLTISQLLRGDTDYYRVPIGTFGSRTTITLSHIPTGSDYDLTVAGPQAPRLRGAALGGIPLTNTQLPDAQTDLNQQSQPLAPETLQDVPSSPLTANGNVIRGQSDNRGSADEQITLISQGETGFYTIQVSNYAGTDATQPYVLDVQQTAPPNLGPCSPRTMTNTNGTAAGPTPALSATTNTLFLVDEARLRATPGFASGDVTTLMSKLSALAGRTDLGITGSVVHVEANSGVVTAYNSWDAVPCDPQRANTVVRSIGTYLDSLLANAPNVKYIVLVGGDDIIPFGRTPDETQIANEIGYADQLGTTNNEYRGSTGQGFLLTDDVWTSRGAQDFLGHELFLPQLASGRLVESPTDISRTIDGYTARNGLVTPAASLVTGYDFLSDGATAVNAPLAAGLGANAKTLINNTWTNTDLLAGMFPTSGTTPNILSLNAHFDHRRLLPANENAAGTQTNLVTTTDITSRGVAAMAGKLGFSMGCHSGLVVSDAIFSAQPILASDWGQAMLGTGALGWIGNTGYGLGDTTAVAYSERLHAIFAGKLDGTLTVGQALAQAKSDYVSTLGVISPYDAKVVMEANFYGLPMLRLGSGIPAAPPPPLPLHTDPATNLQAASFDVFPSFTRVPLTGGPTYYKADNGIQSTPRRPIEPLVSLDVTEPTAVGVAHGAFLRALGQTTADETPFTAIFSQVVTDTSADQSNLTGVTAFPSKPQSISTVTGITGTRQTLNLIAGVFRSTAPIFGVNGVQRNFSRVAGDVFYSNSTDWTPPTLGELEAVTIPNTTSFGFGIDASDAAPGTVKAVNVIYRDCAGTWRTVDLANASGIRWTGAGATGGTCTSVDYYVQAADNAGNVAVSSKKVQVEPVVIPTSTGNLSGGASGGTQQNGWFKTTPVNVTLTLTGGSSPLQFSLDGNAYQDYTGAISVTTDGLHTVDGKTKDGSATTQVAFGIDTKPPTITVNAPANGAVYSVGQQVKIDYYCSDSGSGIASGCTSTPAKGTTLNTSTPGTFTFKVNAAVDQVGNSSGDKTVTYTVGYRKVLFSSTRTGNGDVYSMNLDGTGVTQLTNNGAIDGAPVYSPDGQRILFTSTRTGNGDVYAMNTDGTGVVQLTNSAGVEALGDYSPDGKKIAYTSTVSGNVEVWVMNADGTNKKQLTNNPAIDADPTWSPNGQMIAFASNRIATNNYEIYTMSADGSNQVRVTNSGGFDGEPEWGPTNKIAFTSVRAGNEKDIFTMNSDGTAVTRLTTDIGDDSVPYWSVDGTQILFQSDRKGSAGTDVYSMTSTGANQTRRTTNAAFDGNPAW